MFSSIQPGSEANCTKPICCRKFADQSGAVSVSAGSIGSHGCDTSGTLSQSMLKTVSTQNTLFSIFTGDVVEGEVDFQTFFVCIYLNVRLSASVWLVNQTYVLLKMLLTVVYKLKLGGTMQRRHGRPQTVQRRNGRIR